jgi:hypothetical protein
MVYWILIRQIILLRLQRWTFRYYFFNFLIFFYIVFILIFMILMFQAFRVFKFIIIIIWYFFLKADLFVYLFINLSIKLLLKLFKIDLFIQVFNKSSPSAFSLNQVSRYLFLDSFNLLCILHLLSYKIDFIL